MTGLRAALLGGLCCALAACSTPPAPVDGAAPDVAAKAPSARLSPLARGLAVPAGAAPRSLVPGVNYDLSVPGTGSDDLPPDDGVPGDGAPRDVFERGGASWYGIQFHQKKTANGERFDMGAFTAAHKDQRCGGAVANLDDAPMAAEPAAAPKRSARQAAPKRRR